MLLNLPRILLLASRHLGGYVDLGGAALREWRLELRRRLLLALLAAAGALCALIMISIWIALTLYHTRHWPWLPLYALGGAAALSLLCWGIARAAPGPRSERIRLSQELNADRDLLADLRERYAP